MEKDKGLDLKYIRIGKGKKNALAFHGFGQDNSYYEPFDSILGDKYTIYSFNLPFHGDDNTSKSGIPATKDILRDFFRNFLDRNRIPKFINLGFSIGAKLSMTLLELFPERVEKLILIAPDGFRKNIWYSLGTGSMITRSLFKYLVNHPDYFFRFSDSMASLGFVNPGVIRFAKSQMNTLEKRERVYYTWIFFRKLHIRKDQIVNLLIKHQISATIFLGKEDKIILEKHFRFLNDNRIDANITLFEAGHNDLIKETAIYLERSSGV